MAGAGPATWEDQLLQIWVLVASCYLFSNAIVTSSGALCY